MNNHEESLLDHTVTLLPSPTGQHTAAIDNLNDNDLSLTIESSKHNRNLSIEISSEDLLLQQQEEVEEARRIYRDRKQKAKLKREEKQRREMQKIIEEKKLMEDEMEELRQSAAAANAALAAASNSTGSEEAYESVLEKKANKMKKRYEKKLLQAKDELDDLREVRKNSFYCENMINISLKQEFFYQRKRMMDTMIEQEKDLKLYELICHSIIGEKELRKVSMQSKNLLELFYSITFI